MATVNLTQHELPGALGPILVDVRSSARGATQPAVLIMHGFTGFKDFSLLTHAAERLARAGFAAVTMSASGSGVDAEGVMRWPERFARNTYTRELDDIEAVLHGVHDGAFGFAPSSIGMIGHSRGGGVSLCVAAAMPMVRAIVTWAAISTIRRFDDATMAAWKARGSLPVDSPHPGVKLSMSYEIADDGLANYARFDIERAVRSLDIPWLLIHGGRDETVPMREAELLASWARPGVVEKLLLPEATHRFGVTHPWTSSNPDVEALYSASVRFLSQHLE